MKAKIWLLAMLVVALVVFIPSTAGAYKWKHLGAAPLISGGIDKTNLQEKYSAFKADIIQGIKMAEPNWDATTVVESSEAVIRSGLAKPVTHQPGKKFEWMIFKPKGKVGVERDVEWEGDKPNEALEGYEFDVRGDTELTFFVAAKCGNLGLVQKRQIPKVEAPAPKVEAPVMSQAPPPSPPTPAPPMYSRPPQPVDVCPNIEGVQTVVPQGLVKDQYGNCVIMQVQVDVCANIEGIQTRVPESMIQDSYGNCVVRQYSYYPPPPASPPPPAYEHYPPPAVSYFPPPPPPFLFPFSYYGDDFYSPRYHPPRYHPPRYHPPRYHPPRDHPPRYHPPRVRPPTVRTVPPAVRPPTVRTVPPAVRPPTVRTVSSRGSSSSMSRGSTSRSPGVRTR